MDSPAAGTGTGERELEDLLQFLYQCPVGLISATDDGRVEMINPAAVRLLSPFFHPLPAPGVHGGEDLREVATLLGRIAPSLLTAIRDDPRRLGALTSHARLVLDAPHQQAAAIELAAVRTQPGRVMIVVIDASQERMLADDLAEVTAARLKTLTGVRDAVAALAAAATPEQVLLAAVREGLVATGASAGSVCIAAPDGGYQVVSSLGLPDHMIQEWGHFPDDCGMPLVDAIHRGTPVLLPSIEAVHAGYPLMVELLLQTHGAAWAALPFSSTATLRGGMFFSFPRPQDFTPDLQSTLVALTDVVGQAYVRAQTYLRERQARRQAELLALVGYNLDHAHLTDQERFDVLLDLLVPELADFATLEEAGVDDRSVILAARHTDPGRLPVLLAARDHRLTGGGHPIGVLRVLRTGRSELAEVLTHEELEDHLPAEDDRGALTALGCCSYAIVPLRANGRTVAALLLGHAETGRHFSSDDLDLVQLLASRAALSIDNARLRDREHTIAVDLQAAMLPTLALASPAVEVTARYRPADEHLNVGGDWYDAFELPDDRIQLIVGDVVGHSLHAATVMGQLRSATAALAASASGPAEVVARLDEFTDRLPQAQNTTMCYLDLTAGTGRLRYTNAGHPPPLVRRGRTVLRLDQALTPPLGATFGLRRSQAVLHLQPADVLVLYTDGLVERRDTTVHSGIARLALSLQNAPADLPPAALCDHLLTDLIDGAIIADDIAIMVVVYRGYHGSAEESRTLGAVDRGVPPAKNITPVTVQ